MSGSVKVIVGNTVRAEGRLVGFITDEECKAVINSDDAPKKINTSESTTVNENIGQVIDRRFVLVTRSMMKDSLPAIFISPKIKTLTWVSGKPEFYCEDKKTYVFEEIKDAT